MYHRAEKPAAHHATSLRSAGLSLVLLLLVAAPLAAVDLSSESIETRLHDSLGYLASDELEGRGPGTEGIEMAADYIAEQFREMGLVTELYDGTPFQEFSFEASMELGDPAKNWLVLVGPEPADAEAEPVKFELRLEEDFTPLSAGGSAEFDAEMVFVGYGITAPEFEYDDFADLDVEGKVVVILRKEPQQGSEESRFSGTDATSHAWFTSKIENAAEHGAAALIIVNDDYSVQTERAQLWAEREIRLNRLSEAALELAEVAATAAAAEGVVGDSERMASQRAMLAEMIDDLQETDSRLATDPDILVPFDRAGGPADAGDMPVYFVKRAPVDQIVSSALGMSLAELEAQIDADGQPRSAPLTGWRATGESDLVKRQVQLQNVMAVLEGEGPHAEETIILGAHYDHLGYGGASSLSPWLHEIHNGADDNGSGTAAVLEIARQLAARETPLPRRVVFILFSGEERGLLGSAHYVREPRFPLESTVAMVNLDMVGRMEDNELSINGTGTAVEFPELIELISQPYDLEITQVESGYGPSDHASFAGADIPVLFLFTGIHSDYHRPSDDVERINFEGLRQVCELTRDLVVALAESEAPMEYVQTRPTRPAHPTSDNPRPYFGSIPDYGQQINGLPLSGVASGGPAEQGGLREGDVVIGLGGREISGIEDFDYALRQHKAGDEVEVIVLRGEEELTLTVELGDPR